MNHCIIVSGGVGTRMGLGIPKQYFQVHEVPIILYSIRKFVHSGLIDSIVIVLSDDWKDFLIDWLNKESIPCRVEFAVAGHSRQHSVKNGLEVLHGYAADDDLVFVHDAVRPLFPLNNIIDGISACSHYDGALPVIPVKDATYRSLDGVELSSLLPRHELFSGQSPECFKFGKFFNAHQQFTEEEIGNIRGCSELAFRANLSIRLIPGSEQNFKLTTSEDLEAFKLTFK